MYFSLGADLRIDKYQSFRMPVFFHLIQQTPQLITSKEMGDGAAKKTIGKTYRHRRKGTGEGWH